MEDVNTGQDESVKVEEIDPFEVLHDIEAQLQAGLRTVRAKVFRTENVEQPSMVEDVIGSRPVAAAAVAAAAGYAMGFVVRRFIPPIPFIGRKKK